MCSWDIIIITVGSTRVSAVDDDYDMFFHNPGMAGLVSQAYPFVLKSNAITIGMWVRLTNSELSGTVFFTLYGLRWVEIVSQLHSREIVILLVLIVHVIGYVYVSWNNVNIHVMPLIIDDHVISS